MGTRTRLSKLEQARDAAGSEMVDNFFRLLQAHGKEPAVSAAVEFFWERMRRVEAALGRPVTPREWRDDPWMERNGLAGAIDRLFRAVRQAASTATGNRGDAP
jgi:hypothetical protein